MKVGRSVMANNETQCQHEGTGHPADKFEKKNRPN